MYTFVFRSLQVCVKISQVVKEMWQPSHFRVSDPKDSRCREALEQCGRKQAPVHFHSAMLRRRSHAGRDIEITHVVLQRTFVLFDVSILF